MLADFNGDGFPDLAGSASASGYDDNGYPHDDPGFLAMSLNDGIWTLPPPPPPSIAIGDVSVSGGQHRHAGGELLRDPVQARDRTVTVTYATANGTATRRQRLPGHVRHADHRPRPDDQQDHHRAGQGRPRRRAERDFVVNLSGATNATIADGQGVGTILDDEPRISISDVSKTEGKKDQTTLFTFTVTLSAAYDQPVTMSFRTVDGTAKTSDNDYVAKTGTLTFAPGETTKTITIEVKGDSKKEANETFYLDLFGNSVNSLFTKKRGIGTIRNDD